jgi:hypothetical protein
VDLYVIIGIGLTLDGIGGLCHMGWHQVGLTVCCAPVPPRHLAVNLLGYMIILYSVA